MQTSLIDQAAWVLKSDQFQSRLKKWQTTVNLMADVYQAPAGFIVQYTPNGYQIVVASQSEANPYRVDNGVIPSETNIFCRKVIATCQPLYVCNATQLSEWDDNPEVTNDGFNSYFGLPLFWPDGSPFGTICVMDFAITDYQGAFLKLMEQFRDLICQDLELIQQYRQLEELSHKDYLTDCYNRRGFMTMSESAVQFARRYQKQVGLLYFDLDNLKAINDRQGHSAGDEVIRNFSRALMSNMRESDIAARMGGDEFAALVLVNHEEEIALLIERIRQGLQADIKSPGIAFSVGYQLYGAEESLSIEDMLKQADRLMYQHKQRNSAH